MFENHDHRPEIRLRVSETIEEERDVLTVRGEELSATDSGVQYTQRQQERIRSTKETKIEAS